MATAVGVRESALYNYFPSKDALFDALILAAPAHQERAAGARCADGPIADGRALLEQLAHRQPRELSSIRASRSCSAS